MGVEKTISDFICRELADGLESMRPQPDDPLLASAGGVVDSVGLHKLITFIESEFALTVDDLEIVPENFASFGALVAYVERKRAN